MFLRLILFFGLFLGGIYVMGLSFSLDSLQAVTFIGGLLMFCAACFSIMHWPGSATKASTWE